MMLGEYLQQGTHRARDEGTWDCCTFPCGWAMECGYGDPMAKWRGKYSDEAGALRIIRKRGSLADLYADAMESVGVPEVGTADLVEGDIGVMRLHGDETAGVFTGTRWAFVAERGLAFITLRDDMVVRAWGPNRG